MKPKIVYIPKVGEKTSEDSYDYNLKLHRFAVADGATMGLFSDIFAKSLVERFCKKLDMANKNILKKNRLSKIDDWLSIPRQKWLMEMKSIINSPDVPWFVYNAFLDGEVGASTFIGLELNYKTNSYKSIILGDSCLFHIRNDDIYDCFPFSDIKRFNNYPHLFISKKQSNLQQHKPDIIHKSFLPNDYFILATDAVAKWLLLQKKQGKWFKIWNKLKIHNQEYLEKYFHKQKKIDLDDDDITILIVPCRIK